VAWFVIGFISLGVSSFPDYKPTFPKWSPQSISTIVPDLDDLGIDLLSKMLQYTPKKRISARNAMKHAYFDELKNILKQKEKQGCPVPAGVCLSAPAVPIGSGSTLKTGLVGVSSPCDTEMGVR